MIASLPMYWRPELADAYNRLWAAFQAVMPRAPALTLPVDLPANWDVHWTHPALVLSQTCGLPYRLRLHGKVQLVGCFDHGLLDCPAGDYYSVAVQRAGDTGRPKTLAFNAEDSQSGWAAACAWFDGQKAQIPANLLKTGAHIASARVVADGSADIALLDAQTWAQCQAFDDFAGSLQVVGRTTTTPGLPLITSLDKDPKELRTALNSALAELSNRDRTTLGMHGVIPVQADRYLALKNPPLPADL